MDEDVDPPVGVQEVYVALRGDAHYAPVLKEPRGPLHADLDTVAYSPKGSRWEVRRKRAQFAEWDQQHPVVKIVRANLVWDDDDPGVSIESTPGDATT